MDQQCNDKTLCGLLAVTFKQTGWHIVGSIKFGVCVCSTVVYTWCAGRLSYENATP